MTDQRVPVTRAKNSKKKPKAAKPKVIYTLTDAERIEYENRHKLMLQKAHEYRAMSNYMEAYQDALIEEHDLPESFDLNMETGEVLERLEDANENGSV